MGCSSSCVPVSAPLVGLGRLLGRVGEPMAAVAWMTTVLTIVLLAFYNLEPAGPKLRGLNSGPALVFLADSVLAAGAAEGRRNGPVSGLGPLAEPAGSLGLRHLGRLRAAQSLDPPLDPRCP